MGACTLRVPAAFAEVDPRGVIRQSTKIRVVDDPRKVRALRTAQKINDELKTFWRASLGGQKADAQARYDQARIVARRVGFEYLGATEVARLPMDEILRRIETLAEGEIVAAVGVADGQSVLVLEGPFASFPAIVEAVLAGDTVKVVVSLFGRPVPLVLDFAKVATQ